MEYDEKKHGTGLVELPENPGKRPDILASRILGVTPVDDLPKADFIVAEPIKIKNQGALDFCTGFASSEVTEDQEGVEIDPLFQFAAGKRITKDFKAWGCDLRSMGMGLVTYGSLPAKLAPFQVWAVQGRDFLANWANYAANLWAEALKHKKKTMVFVDGPHDLFDNIRSVMWLNKATKRSVLLGVVWRKSWNKAPGGVIPEWTPLDPADIAGGHCIKGSGQKFAPAGMPKAHDPKDPYIVIVNSWGEIPGDYGRFYFPRSVINKDFGPYGQITFVDMDPEDAHKVNDQKKGTPAPDPVPAPAPTPSPVPTPEPVVRSWLLEFAHALEEAFKKLFNIK